MRVKLHELRQGSSLEAYINDLDNLPRHLQLPEQQKIHYFIFGLNPKLKQARLVRQPQTYDDAVIFAKRKNYFADTDSDTQLMDLLQEIRNEVSFKRTGIKQELYSAPVQDTRANQLQQDISQLQADMQILKESMTTPQHQYVAPLDTNPATLQQQLSKMKPEIRHLKHMKRRNAYPTIPGNYRNFGTTDGLVICRRCNRVGHFARACKTNLTPTNIPTHYQSHRSSYVPHDTSQCLQPLYIPNHSSQRALYKTNGKRHEAMGYHYPQDAIYSNPSRKPLPLCTNQTNSKYQARRSNIPSQHKNYNNVIQNHALQDQQCLVSGNLDNKPITILIDTGSSISLLDEQFYYSLSSVSSLQPIPFSV